MSIRTTNEASRIVLLTALESGAHALAAVALNSPIGALGGALFGGIRFVSQLPLIKLGTSCLNANHPQATAAKTLAKALQFFGSYAIAWAMLALAGFTLTFTHVVALTVLSIVYEVGLSILMNCMGMNLQLAQES